LATPLDRGCVSLCGTSDWRVNFVFLGELQHGIPTYPST
jgi:hypothetical protein